MFHSHNRKGDVQPSTQATEISRRKREICNIAHNGTWEIERFMLSIRDLLETVLGVCFYY